MTKALTHCVTGCLLVALVGGCGMRRPGADGPVPLADSDRLAQGAPTPDVSRETFLPVSFSDTVDQHRSRWDGRSQSVELSREEDGGLRCRVVGSSTPGNQYGGLQFAVPSAKALRLELSFSGAEGIAVVYVDAYSAEGRRVVRWAWRPGPSRPIADERGTYTFVPGKPMGYFEAVEGAKESGASVRQVDVFIAGRPEAVAEFILYRAEYAEAR